MYIYINIYIYIHYKGWGGGERAPPPLTLNAPDLQLSPLSNEDDISAKEDDIKIQNLSPPLGMPLALPPPGYAPSKGG